jgi:hypothetical protein
MLAEIAAARTVIDNRARQGSAGFKGNVFLRSGLGNADRARFVIAPGPVGRNEKAIMERVAPEWQREMELTICGVIKKALPEISRELEATAADLGIWPGAGWRERVGRELESLPHPDYESCLFAALPAPFQARARCLHLVGWLSQVIDTPRLIWDDDGSPTAFDDELKLMRAWRAKAGTKGAVMPLRNVAA